MFPPLLVVAFTIAGYLAGLVSYPWVSGIRLTQCDAYPLDQVRCTLRRGHRGRHAIHPADVMTRGYERRPF